MGAIIFSASRNRSKDSAMVEQPYAPILITLIVVWMAVYVVGMLTGKPNPLQTRRLPLASKLIMIGVVVALGAAGWLGWTNATRVAAYGFWIFMGLVLGGLGDILLAEVWPVRQAKVMALGVFGLGHLCYIAAIFSMRTVLEIPTLHLLTGMVVSCLIGWAIWALAIRSPVSSRTMNIGSLIYGSMLFAAAGAGAGAEVASSKMRVMAIGLALFALSDVILAQYMVRRRRFPYIRDVVWIIYSTGQMIIALSSAVGRK